MSKPFLGVLHVPPLPSAAGWRGSFAAAADHVMRDAEALAAGGVDGVILENFGDAPFHKGTRDDPVPPDVVAGLAVLADRVRRSSASGSASIACATMGSRRSASRRSPARSGCG